MTLNGYGKERKVRMGKRYEKLQKHRITSGIQELFRKTMVLWLSLAMVLTSGFFQDVQFVKAESGIITLSFQKLETVEVEEKENTVIITGTDVPEERIDFLNGNRTMSSAASNNVIHMDVNSRVTLGVTLTENSGRWGAAIADHDNNVIEELQVSPDVNSVGKWGANSKMGIAIGGNQLRLTAGSTIHGADSDFHLYVYNYGEGDVSTVIFKAKIQVYNGAYAARVVGDDFIVGTKSKTYSTQVRKTDLGEVKEDDYNTSLPTTDRFSWSVNDTEMATVGELTGVLTAKDKKNGNVILTGQAQNGIVTTADSSDLVLTKKRNCEIQKTIKITERNSATKIEFKQPEFLLANGTEMAMSSQITTEPSERTDTFNWVSSDESVATVSENGVVKAKKAGTTTITVQGDNPEVMASCTIHVYVPAQKLTTYLGESKLRTESMSLRNGNSTIIRVEQLGFNQAVATETIEASVSLPDLVTIETVDTMGGANTKYYKVTFAKSVTEKTKCTVTFRTKESEIAQDFRLDLFPPVTDQISVALSKEGQQLRPSEVVDVYIGDKLPTVLNAELKGVVSSEPNDQFYWTFSGNDDFVQQTDAESSVSLVGKKKGTATLTATARSNANVKQSVQIRVLQAAQEIHLDSQSLSVPQGQLVQMKAELVPASSDETVLWSSTDTSVVSVDENGRVVAINPGTAQIKATTAHSKLEAVCSITVTQASAVSLSEYSRKVAYGSKASVLTAAVKDTDGTTMENPTITWSSSNEEVASLVSSNTKTVTVNYGKVGTAYITASYGESEKAVCVVTVTEDVKNVSVEGLGSTSAEATAFVYRPNGMKPDYQINATCDHDVRGTAGLYALQEGVDYTITELDEIAKVGRHTVTFTGTELYTSARNLYYTVNAKDISEISCYVPDQTYTGLGLKPEPELTYTENGQTQSLVKGTDFTVSYTNNVNAGTGIATIAGKGNFTGTIEVPFTIYPCQVSKLTFGMSKVPTYTGQALEPTVTYKLETRSATLGTDYTLSYTNNTNACNDQAIITMTAVEGGNYTGSRTDYFTILPADVSRVSSAVEAQTYTGGEIVPPATVTFGEQALVQGQDYTITASNNVAVGSASYALSGMGNYTGTKNGTFNIKKADLSTVTIAPIAPQYYCGGAALYPSLQVSNGVITLQEGVDYTVDYENNAAVGTGKATIKAISDGNFTGTNTTEFQIVLKENIANPGDNMTVTPISGAALAGDTIYVDTNSISYYQVELTSSTGVCDDVAYVSAAIDEGMFEAGTTLINDGSKVLLAVKGMKPGSTKLYLETLGGKIRKTINVEVYAPAKSFTIELTDHEGKKATLSGGQASIVANHTVQLTAQMDPTNSTDKIQWSVSNPSVATVDEDGLLTALQPGTVQVTGTVKATETGSRGLSVSGIFTVIENIPATSITLDQTELNLKEGESKVLTASLEPANNTEQIIWSSSDEKIATVTQTGKVQAVSKGTAVISCKNFDGNVVANCTVTVYAPAKSVTMSEGERTLTIGDVFQLTASLVPDTAEEAVKWSASKEGIVSLTEMTTGAGKESVVQITALAEGTVTLTATTVGTNRTGKCTIRVLPAAQPQETPQDQQQTATMGGNVTKVTKITAKNVKKKSIRVSWTSVKNASGYELAYGVRKNFKGAKVKRLKGTACKITKLKKKKNYYIRVRGYATVSGKKQAGPWSKIIKVKVKK